MQTYSFTAPSIVAHLTQKHLGIPLADATVVDAGCGSGLVGVELANLGFETIDGLDFSEGMLKIARKTGVYRGLRITDLTRELDAKSCTYDVLVCSGVFTHGHLGPESLPEFVRIVKKNGLLVITVLNSFWKEKGFKDSIERLENNDTVRVLENNLHKYRKFGETESGGLVLVLRRV